MNLKQKRNHLYFHLMSDELVARIDSPFEIDFRMEAGFIAECVEQLYERKCECSESFNKRLYRAEFEVVFID